jgi:hypothetical protein
MESTNDLVAWIETQNEAAKQKVAYPTLEGLAAPDSTPPPPMLKVVEEEDDGNATGAGGTSGWPSTALSSASLSSKRPSLSAEALLWEANEFWKKMCIFVKYFSFFNSSL